MKQIALLSMAVAMFIAFASCGYAVSVAYVVRNPASPNNDFVQALQENGFTVTLIDDNNAATTNFSKYTMILVGEEVLVNPSAVPIKDYPSLVANTQHLSVWGYASTAGVVSVGNGFLKGKLMVNNSITSGLPAVVQLYTSYGINGYFLPKLPDRSRDIQNVVGTNNADLNPFIGTYKAGDRLYGGGYAKTRGCFYGLVNSRYWTADAKTLFIRCAKYVAYAFDKDGDGYIEAVDCDDSNAQVNPSMTEVLYNGLDDDCNPATLDDDLDLDGYKLANDCNDKNSAINPGVADIPYNNIDENCDGFDLADVDQDGYCKSGYIVKSRALQCPQETGTAGTDCNDNDATIHPKATEIPYDSIDQDCNGADLLDADGDGYCKSGYSIINKALQCAKESGKTGTDCNDTTANVSPGTAETPYNGIDDDCNPATLDNDLDKDGYLKADDCNDNNANVNPGKTEIPYNLLDDDCNASTLDDDLDIDGYLKANDCNDNDPQIKPNATDIPYDHIDQNCDGYDTADADKDGYCKQGYSITSKASQCANEKGNTGTDCNDNEPNVNPGKAELPYNGIDDDCSTATLDDDLDQDGFVQANDCNDNNAGINPSATEIPYNSIDENCDGYDLIDVDNDGYNHPADCNDTNPNVNPGKPEIPYNRIDDDCNASTRNDDLDEDGYLLANDCNDANPNVNPGVREIYFNGIDDDCNPETVDDDHTPPNAPQNLRAAYKTGSVLLLWDKPLGEPVEVYKIYVSDNHDNFDFGSVTANTSQLSWTDDQASSHPQRYYIVRAQDPAGNEENNTYTVGKFDITLHTGYNLISMPLVPYNNSLESLTDGQGLVEIMRYRQGKFENALNSNGSWKSDFGLINLYNSEGYFVRGVGTFTVTGSVPAYQQSVALAAGLNLVGFTSLGPSNLSSAFAQNENDYSIAEIARYDNGYQFATYYPSQHSWYSKEGLGELNPGQGYWIMANKQTNWNYQAK